jgi:predicted small integral membrane protein
MDGTPGAGRHLRRRQDPGPAWRGLALVVWMDLFSVVGGAYFQMWRTPPGSAPLGGAFQYPSMRACVLLLVNMPDA